MSTLADDGVTQSVTARVGIAKLGEAELPNPIRLTPIRTFPELDQPSSLFVLRVRSGAAGSGLPLAALFESDGGAWQNEAIRAACDWLHTKAEEHGGEFESMRALG